MKEEQIQTICEKEKEKEKRTGRKKQGKRVWKRNKNRSWINGISWRTERKEKKTEPKKSEIALWE